MNFLGIIFGKVLDFFFKKNSGSGISIKSDHSKFQARDISNTNISNSNNTTFQQTVYVNTPLEVDKKTSDIQTKHHDFWGSVIHGFMFGATAFFAILFSVVNVDMQHKTNLFSKVLSNNYWIILGCLTIGIFFRKKIIKLTDKLYQFIFSDDRKEHLMVYFGTNILQHKIFLSFVLLVLNTIIIYYISKIFFLIIS